MKRLRSQITQIIVLVLVGTGLGLYMVQPVHVDHSSQSFADWLSKKATDRTELQKELNNLQESADPLEKTIKEASQIVNRNNGDFEFSFAESLVSQHLYQLLLIEWNQSQTENAMAAVPIQHISKLIVSATIDKSGVGDVVSNGVNVPDILYTMNNLLFESNQFMTLALIPMVHGIAIGAP